MAYKELLLENKLTVPLLHEYTILDWWYSSLLLSFNMELQTQSNWCWAATSKSVSRFYSIFSPWTQCKVASKELDKTCCDSPVPAACNVPWYLDRALTRTNNFVSYQSGPITWEQVKQELEKGLVVGARIGWSGGGGHFMVIYGVSKSMGLEFLHIDDPIYGKSTLTYNQFATNYQGSGTWTHTYFTKKYFYFMWFDDLIFNPVLLKPIPSVRPLLNVYGEKVETVREMIMKDLTVPHYIFNVGLNDIKDNMKPPQNPTSLRVLEIKDKAPVAFYEVGLNEENPELIQMNANKSFFDQMDHAMSRLKEADKRNKSKGEIRTLRIPALNMEAIWLNYPDRTEDLVAMLPRFEYKNIQSGKVYTLKEFSELLQKEKKQLGEYDETMGA